MGSRALGLRVTEAEMKFFDEAAAALDVGRSALAECAVLDLIHRMGYFDDEDRPGRQRVFTEHPRRAPDEMTAEKFNVTFAPMTFELVERVVEEIALPAGIVGANGEPERVSLTMFVLGATFRYVANRRRKARTALSSAGREDKARLRRLVELELLR